MRPWVEQCVAKVLEVDAPQRDDDGCCVVQLERVKAYVRVADGPADTPRVVIHARVRDGVEVTPEFSERLNAANGTTPYLKVVLHDGELDVVTECVAESLMPVDLLNAFGLIDAAVAGLPEFLGLPAVQSAEGSVSGEKPDGEDEAKRDLARAVGPAAHVDVPSSVLPRDPSPADGAVRIRMGEPGSIQGYL